MATAPYIHKVPVEIWREVLRSTVGPSLSDHERNTLRAYDALFIYYKSLAERYITKECIRHKLMLVCKLWRDIVEDMDDKMVFGGMDEFDWPPNKRRNEAKYIYYLELVDNSFSQDPISTSRIRRKRDAAAIPKSRGWQETLELVVNADSPPAPVMLVDNMRIKLGNEVPTTFNGLVRVFHWMIPDENPDVEILHTSLFDNLTYLSLSVYTLGFPQALVQPQWTFPTLRALVVSFCSEDINRDDAFGQWRCPNLTMLRCIDTDRVDSPILPGMLTFINNHAQKLEELHIWADSKLHSRVEENWKQLVALKSYTLRSFVELMQVLPFMRGLWNGVDDASVTRRLRIELKWDTRDDDFPLIYAQGAQYKHLLAKIDLSLPSSWPSISESARFGRKEQAVDLLAIVDKLELDVFDVDGRPLDSPEGQKLREDLELVSANSNK